MSAKMSNAFKIIALSAGMSENSTTTRLAREIAQGAAAAVGADVEILELCPYARDVAEAMVTGFPSERLERILHSVETADALVVGTPVYNAMPSGLFVDCGDRGNSAPLPCDRTDSPHAGLPSRARPDDVRLCRNRGLGCAGHWVRRKERLLASRENPERKPGIDGAHTQCRRRRSRRKRHAVGLCEVRRKNRAWLIRRHFPIG